MRIIFVNVDEALCTYRMQHSGLALKYRGEGVVERDTRFMSDIDPVSCGLLLKICKKYGVGIVPILDSSVDNVYEWFISRFETYCPELVSYIVTPSIKCETNFVSNSGETIADVLIEVWLDRYSEILGIDDYIIVDKIVRQSDKHDGHYIRCNHYDGFGFTHYVKCLYHLESKHYENLGKKYTRIFVEGLGTIDANGRITDVE